eukprot:2173571-Prymnesium_polylepis.1
MGGGGGAMRAAACAGGARPRVGEAATRAFTASTTDGAKTRISTHDFISLCNERRTLGPDASNTLPTRAG